MKKEILYGLLFSFILFLVIGGIHLGYNELKVNFGPTEQIRDIESSSSQYDQSEDQISWEDNI